MTRKSALIYCRISQDREGAGLGVERQRADCRALAQRLGWQVVGEHIDNDVSAYAGKPRPGYRALLADLEAGRADAVLVWHTDRLHRSPRELEDYIALCERRRIVTETCTAGSLDLNTPSGRMVARMLGAAARQEVEHKSDRIRRAQLQAVQAGRWLGGTPPLGWHVRDDGSAVLDRAAAGRIRRATADVLAGASLGSIVKAWNSGGFTTGTGRKWNYATLRQVLTRPRNAGLVDYHGEIVARSTWPAIVTEDQWRALCALLSDPNRRRSQSNRARWLLAGIAVCGAEECGLRLRSATVVSNRAKGTTRTVYRCSGIGRGHVARSAEQLDELVNAVIVGRLARADVADLLHDDADKEDLVDVRAEAVALRHRLNEAADAFADGNINATQLARITGKVQKQLATVEATLANGAKGSVLSGIVGAKDPVKAWKSAPIDRRRAIVKALLTVTVLPSGKRGNGFDPELVRVAWRSS